MLMENCAIFSITTASGKILRLYCQQVIWAFFQLFNIVVLNTVIIMHSVGFSRSTGQNLGLKDHLLLF